jgi:hypothetical protein
MTVDVLPVPKHLIAQWVTLSDGAHIKWATFDVCGPGAITELFTSIPKSAGCLEFVELEGCATIGRAVADIRPLNVTELKRRQQSRRASGEFLWRKLRQELLKRFDLDASGCYGKTLHRQTLYPLWKNHLSPPCLVTLLPLPYSSTGTNHLQIQEFGFVTSLYRNFTLS